MHEDKKIVLQGVVGFGRNKRNSEYVNHNTAREAIAVTHHMKRRFIGRGAT